MKYIFIIIMAISLTVVSTNSLALAEGDVVTCSCPPESNCWDWEVEASAEFPVGGLVDDCLSEGGTATVSRPSLAGPG